MINFKDAGWFDTSKVTNVIHHINKMKDKNVIISTDAEKHLTEHIIYDKNSQQSGYTGNVPQHNKVRYEKPTAKS